MKRELLQKLQTAINFNLKNVPKIYHLPSLMLNTVSYLEGPDECWQPNNEGHPVILFENNRNRLKKSNGILLLF